MDIVSVKKRSQMMSGIKSRNTKPEIVVRKHLFSLGYRHRINRKIFGIRPDIVMPKLQIVQIRKNRLPIAEETIKPRLFYFLASKR